MSIFKNTDWEILGIDSFRHKGTQSRLNEVLNQCQSQSNRFKSFIHDLSVPIDNVLQNKLLEKDFNGNYKPINYIINLASDSAVERSIIDPVSCFKNNCEIGINMLEFARKNPPDLFIAFSTDEVYGDAKGQPHHEWDTILPSNVYAASKAAQEAAAIAYFRSYNLPIVISNTMNIIGEWQDPEKFLPKLIGKIATNQKMQIYTSQDGTIGSRFYIHAKNVADALIFLCNRKPSRYKEGSDRPDRWNIVGELELDNLQAAKLVAKIMEKELCYELVPPSSIRPGYDKRYALDGSKMAQAGWKAPLDTEDSIKQIVNWSCENSWWII